MALIPVKVAAMRAATVRIASARNGRTEGAGDAAVVSSDRFGQSLERGDRLRVAVGDGAVNRLPAPRLAGFHPFEVEVEVEVAVSVTVPPGRLLGYDAKLETADRPPLCR